MIHFILAIQLLQLKWYLSHLKCQEEEVQEHEHFLTGLRVLKISLGRKGFGFPVVAGSVVLVLATEFVGRSRPASPRGGPGASPGSARAGSALQSANTRAVATVGGTDCLVSRLTGSSDPGRVHLS